MERSYRNRASAKGLVSFQVSVKETDLWVSAEKNLEKETRDLVFECRHHLETYISTHPDFLTSLAPQWHDPYAPSIVKEMIGVTRRLNVGPMASVAGAIAQYVGKGLIAYTGQVIVENGGDIFLKTTRPATISILAGNSPLSGKFGLLVPVNQMPLGVCSSSGTVGHSLSMGCSDVVCLLACSATLADGAATAVGNQIKAKEDVSKVFEWVKQIQGIHAGVIIVEDRVAIWGEIELVGLR